MDIFQESKRDLLKKYKLAPRLLSPLKTSTCSIFGWLSGVSHNEADLIDIPCEGNIVKIDSNYYHAVHPDYKEFSKKKISNRGRKKKPKEKKTRQCQGDGSCFSSQVTFTILGTHIRDCPIIADKHSIAAIQLENNKEQVTKEYKIKLFRNGKITIPGILTKNMEDIITPIKELCTYLSDLFIEDVHIVSLISVMRNYKFRLLKGHIDINKLQEYCEGQFEGLILTSIKDIIQFIINPIFVNTSLGNDVFSINLQWNNIIAYNQINENLSIDWESFEQFLSESETQNKQILINFQDFISYFNEKQLIDTYNKVQQIANLICNKYYVELTSTTIRCIIKMILRDVINKLEKNLKKSKNNLMSHTTYDSERYPAFLIKLKTPLLTKPKKKTTVKIFPKGKINIDGANNIYQSKFIYYWLNYLFWTHEKTLIYNDDDPVESDSEFSSGEYSI